MSRAAHLNVSENLLREANAGLEDEIELRRDLENEIKDLKARLKLNSRLTRVQDELELAENSNLRLEQEVREIRRRLRMAQLEAEKVPDLEAQLSSMQSAFTKMKIDSVKHEANNFMTSNPPKECARMNGFIVLLLPLPSLFSASFLTCDMKAVISSVCSSILTFFTPSPANVPPVPLKLSA